MEPTAAARMTQCIGQRLPVSPAQSSFVLDLTFVVRLEGSIGQVKAPREDLQLRFK